MKKTVVLIATFAVLVLLVNVWVAMATSRSLDVTLQNVGKITLIGVEAYGGDLKSLNGDLTVDIGEIGLGKSKTFTFNLRSISNVPVSLAISAHDWEPNGLESFMQISWDYSGRQILPSEEILVRVSIASVFSPELFQYVLSKNVNSFSFSLSISANE